MTSICKMHFIKIFIVFFSLFIVELAVAQEEKTELEKQMDEQKLKTELAESRKKEADALNAMEMAKYPTSDTKGLEGTVTFNEGAGYYSEILAYEALDSCAKKIAQNLKKSIEGEKTLIIFGEVDLAAEAVLWKRLDFTLKAYLKELDKAIGQSMEDESQIKIIDPLTVLAVAPAILGAVTDLISFFKTNYTLTARNVVLNEQALFSTMADELKRGNPDLKIIFPDKNIDTESEILQLLNDLAEKRNKLQSIRDRLNSWYLAKIVKQKNALAVLKTREQLINKEIDELIKNGKDTKALVSKLSETMKDIARIDSVEANRNQVIIPLDRILTGASDLVKIITSKPDGGISPFESVRNIDLIKKNPDSKLLYLTIVSQGGEIQTSQSSLSQGRATYIGGTVVSYLLTTDKGVYENSGNEKKVKTDSFKRKKGATSLEEKYN